MKQILQNLKTGKVEVAEIPVPSVKTGHLLIKTTKSLISLGTERMLLEFGKAGWINKARKQPDKVKQVIQKIRTDGLMPTVNTVFNKLDQPLALGYSNVGIIKELGKGVNGFKVGDRVVSNGPHAEIVCVPENLCAKIPDGVNDVTASFTVLSAIALQGIRLINPTLGESVAIIGLGLIGLLSCQILRANGCRVIGFELDKRKIDIARRLGFESYDLTGVDPVSTALTFSKGYGVDAVLITASTKSNDPIRQAPKICRKRGRVVLVGVTGLELSRDDFYKKEISFQVSCSYGPGRYETDYEKKGLDYPIGYVRWTEQRNFEAVLQLMADGQIKTDDLITDIIPIGDAVKIYGSIVSEGNALGLVLDYSKEVDLDQKTVILSVKTTVANRLPEEPVIGFIGAGNFAGSTIIPAFKRCNVRLKTIASLTGVSGSHLGKKYGFELNTTDYRSILDDLEINTVVITTQHNSHACLVIDSLKAGKNLFVEKPLCLTMEELTEIGNTYNNTLKTKRLLLMIGFNRRFAPLIQKVKGLIDPLPEPKCFIMTVNAGIIPEDHWTQDIEVGGGRVIGEGCHFIDLLRFLAGVKIAKSELLKLGDKQGDTVTISLGFVDGSIGTIHYLANGNKGFPKERLEVFCSGKILQLDNFNTLRGYGYSGFNKRHLRRQDKGHQREVVEFLDSIEKGLPSPIPFEEIKEVTKLSIELSRQ